MQAAFGALFEQSDDGEGSEVDKPIGGRDVLGVLHDALETVGEDSINANFCSLMLWGTLMRCAVVSVAVSLLQRVFSHSSVARQGQERCQSFGSLATGNDAEPSAILPVGARQVVPLQQTMRALLL